MPMDRIPYGLNGTYVVYYWAVLMRGKGQGLYWENASSAQNSKGVHVLG